MNLGRTHDNRLFAEEEPCGLKNVACTPTFIDASWFILNQLETDMCRRDRNAKLEEFISGRNRFVWQDRKAKDLWYKVTAVGAGTDEN